MSYLKPSRLDLRERLIQHIQHDVALQSQNFDSGPGLLQKVGKRFVLVNDTYYVPYVMQEIVLLGLPVSKNGQPVRVLTTYTEPFSALLVRTGLDFAEFSVDREDEEEELTLLIPLGKIIGITKQEENG